MEDDPQVGGVPVSQLKVVELKEELERRGLEKRGNKKELSERLREYLLSEDGQKEKVQREDNPILKIYMAEQAKQMADVDSSTPRRSTSVEKPTEEMLVSDGAQAETLTRRGRASRGRKVSEREQMMSPSRRSTRRGRSGSSPKKIDYDELVMEDTPVEDHENGGASENNEVVTTQPEKAVSNYKKAEGKEKSSNDEGKRRSKIDIKPQESEAKKVSEENEFYVAKANEDEQTKEGEKISNVKQKVESNERPIISEETLDVDLGDDVKSDDEHSDDEMLNESEKVFGDSKASKKNLDHGEGEELDYGDGDVEEPEESAKNEIKSNEPAVIEDFSNVWLPEKDGFKRKKEPSPSRYEKSDYVHIRGLTRPYTSDQLNALISKNGKVVRFWTDKVKSHCIVQMSSVDEACCVRRALHNVVWPDANPKALSVQFTTEEQFERYASNKSDAPSQTLHEPIIAPVSSRRDTAESNSSSRNALALAARMKITVVNSVRENEKTELKNAERNREKRENDRKRKRSETPPHSRRLQDIKRRIDGERCPRSRSREREYTRERARSHERAKEVIEERPKDLNELFRRTNTTPAIYYLPLTDDEVAKRQAEREAAEKVRAAEREQREQRREKERNRRSRSRSRNHRR